MEANEIIAGIEKLVEQAVDRKLSPMVAARVAEALSHRPEGDNDVFARLVASGNVFLKIKTAAAIADCHEKTIKRVLAVGELTRFGLRGDPRIRLGDLLNYLARQDQVENPDAIRERARAVARGNRPKAP